MTNLPGTEGPITTGLLSDSGSPRPRESDADRTCASRDRATRPARRRNSTTPASPKVASEPMGHRTRKYQPGPAAITLGRYTQTLPAKLARVAICSTRSSPSAFPRTPLGADAEFSFPPAFPRLRRPACQAGLRRTSAGLQNRQALAAPGLEGSIPSPLRSIEGEDSPRARASEALAVATGCTAARMIGPTRHAVGDSQTMDSSTDAARPIRK